MIPLGWAVLGCLGWLLAASGLAWLIGQAVRLADRSIPSG